MTLTEQWKNNKLEEYKKYYCKTKWFEDIFQARCYNKDTKGEWWCLENEKYRYNNIFHTKDIEVLAPVPSYEEWQEEQKSLKVLAEEYCKEKEKNQQLKELHKRLKDTQNLELEVRRENQQLKAQIAKLAEIVGVLPSNHSVGNLGYKIKNQRHEINNRLKEIDKLKKLLKECGRQLEEVELCRYDVADVDQEDWFRISTEQAGIAKKMKTKIDNAIGEKK